MPSSDDVAAVLRSLADGRQALETAAEHYGRQLGPDDYWWLSVCLAGMLLAELNDMPHAGDRIGVLADDIGRQGVSARRAEDLANELATLNSQGLLWPRFQRGEDGAWRPTAADLHPDFGPEEAYWFSLCHVGTALAQPQDAATAAPPFAAIAAELITDGYRDGVSERILGLFAALPGETDPDV